MVDLPAQQILSGPSELESQGPTDTATRDSTDAAIEGSADAATRMPTALSYPPMETPTAVITFRNRGEALAEVVSRLRALGIDDLVLIDNASSDPALAATLKVLATTVIRLDVDLGGEAPWATGVMAKLLANGNVLDIAGPVAPGAGCPDDVLDRMTEELRRHHEVDAVDLRHDAASPDGETTFRLLRRGLRSRPERIAQLDSPYSAMAIRSRASEPTERYARLHDGIDAPGGSVAEDG